MMSIGTPLVLSPSPHKYWLLLPTTRPQDTIVPKCDWNANGLRVDWAPEHAMMSIGMPLVLSVSSSRVLTIATNYETTGHYSTQMRLKCEWIASRLSPRTCHDVYRYATCLSPYPPHKYWLLLPTARPQDPIVHKCEWIASGLSPKTHHNEHRSCIPLLLHVSLASTD